MTVATTPRVQRRILTIAIGAVAAAGLLVGTIVLAPSLGSNAATDRAALVQGAEPQTVPVTIAPNPSQNVLIPAPVDNDFTKIPAITTSSPNLVLASATYSPDHKNLVISVMNAIPSMPTSGQLTVGAWGSFPVTVEANPSQLVSVDIPTGYDTSKLPAVTSDNPNLSLFSTTYGYQNGTVQLVVNIGNPFPNSAVTGDIRITW